MLPKHLFSKASWLLATLLPAYLQQVVASEWIATTEAARLCRAVCDPASQGPGALNASLILPGAR